MENVKHVKMALTKNVVTLVKPHISSNKSEDKTMEVVTVVIQDASHAKTKQTNNVLLVHQVIFFIN